MAWRGIFVAGREHGAAAEFNAPISLRTGSEAYLKLILLRDHRIHIKGVGELSRYGSSWLVAVVSL